MNRPKTLIKISIKFLLLILTLGVIKVSNVNAQQPITPIPLVVEVDRKKAELGKMLFNDTRLSSNNKISCASCHDLDHGFGTDLKQFSDGVDNHIGVRNSPTVINSVFNFKQFWDGRSDDLVDQARLPVINPIEMGMLSWNDAIDNIDDDSQYITMFDKIYGGINEDNIVDAIAEFEKTLISANSPFDQFLRGNLNAINDEQKKGYQLFQSYGCVSCHQGVNVGGNMFQKFGVLKDISLNSGTLNDDLGRYEVTNNEWDKRVFKVPSLRLAVKTPPYFHDGSVNTIEEAVNIMIEFQLGRNVPDEDRDSIIAFLESLVGDMPKGVK